MSAGLKQLRCSRCPLAYSLHIIMILHSYVEQVMMMCRTQEGQLLLSYFLSYFPLIVSDVTSSAPFGILPYIIMIL